MATEDRRTRAEKMRRLLEAQLAAAAPKPDPAPPQGPGGAQAAELPTVNERVRAVLLALLVLLMGLAAACGSDGGEPDPNLNPNPNPNPNPGALSIAAIAPDSPWLGDTITVTGSGFGTDAGALTVRFPECDPDGCTIYAAKVVSAAGTQLRVELTNVPGNAIIKRGRMRVRLNGVNADAPAVTEFKIPPGIRFEENYNYHFDPPALRGGDSLWFIVQGWNTAGGNSLHLEAYEAIMIDPNDVLEPETGRRRVFTVLPPRTFGTGPIANRDDQQMVPVQFSANGRTQQELMRAFRVPAYEVTSASPSTLDVSNGDVLTIGGTNMPGTIEVEWYGLPSGANTYLTTANGCATVCNSVTTALPAGMVPGNYQIVVHLSIFTEETVVGLGDVTVVP